MRIRCLVLAVSLLCLARAVEASEEGMLIWSEFSISSAGIGESGAVRVSGTQAAEGLSSLKVNAFGREAAASSRQLSELKGFFANGALLSYEGGYKQLGGRTLYLILQKGFTSGVQITRIVEFNERGDLRISKDRTR